MADNKTAEKTRVFISYARKDMAWADWIVEALQNSGIEVLIDREAIAKGEDFQERIFSLINQADAVVYLITPKSVTSKFCNIEVDYAESLNKRFVPLLIQDLCTPDEQPLLDENGQPMAVPDALARINWVKFTQGHDANISMRELLDALLIDLDWVREHTRLGSLALRWDKAGKSTSQLLRGKDLESAENWRDTHPKKASPPTDLHLQFINESRKSAGRRRNVLMGSLMAGLLLAIGLGGWGWWQKGVAERQTEIAEKNEKRAKIASDNARRREVLASSQLAASLYKEQFGKSARQPYLAASNIARATAQMAAAAQRAPQTDGGALQKHLSRLSAVMNKMLRPFDEVVGQTTEKIVLWNGRTYISSNGRLKLLSNQSFEYYAFIEERKLLILIGAAGETQVWDTQQLKMIREEYLSIHTICGVYVSSRNNKVTISGIHHGVTVGSTYPQRSTLPIGSEREVEVDTWNGTSKNSFDFSNMSCFEIEKELNKQTKWTKDNLLNKIKSKLQFPMIDASRKKNRFEKTVTVPSIRAVDFNFRDSKTISPSEQKLIVEMSTILKEVNSENSTAPKEKLTIKNALESFAYSMRKKYQSVKNAVEGDKLHWHTNFGNQMKSEAICYLPSNNKKGAIVACHEWSSMNFDIMGDVPPLLSNNGRVLVVPSHEIEKLGLIVFSRRQSENKFKKIPEMPHVF